MNRQPECVLDGPPLMAYLRRSATADQRGQKRTSKLKLRRIVKWVWLLPLVVMLVFGHSAWLEQDRARAFQQTASLYLQQLYEVLDRCERVAQEDRERLGCSLGEAALRESVHWTRQFWRESEQKFDDTFWVAIYLPASILALMLRIRWDTLPRQTREKYRSLWSARD